MTTRTITKSLYLAAAPERVWDYLTKSELLAKWFHPAQADLCEGADYALLGDDGNPLCFGKVIEISPPSKLVYSFTAGPMNGLMTEVTWTLTPIETGTLLELSHTGVPAGAQTFGLLSALDKGWDKHLSGLRAIDA